MFLRTTLGDSKAAVTQPGPDGGIDVVGGIFCAQAKFYADRPVSAPEVQQFFGASVPENLRPLFFTFLGGYTESAREFAERAGVCLFEFEPDERTFQPVNSRADELLIARSHGGQHPGRSESASLPADDVQASPSEGWDFPRHGFGGWYADPFTPDKFRYWDGYDWTGHTRDG